MYFYKYVTDLLCCLVVQPQCVWCTSSAIGGQDADVPTRRLLVDAPPSPKTLPISMDVLGVVGVVFGAGLMCGLTSFLLIQRHRKRVCKSSEKTECEQDSCTEVKGKMGKGGFTDGIDLKMPMHIPIKNAILSGPIHRIEDDWKSASAPATPRVRFESSNATELDGLDITRRIATIAVTRSESADDTLIPLRHKYCRSQTREDISKESSIFKWNTKNSITGEGDLVPVDIRRASTNPVYCEADNQKAVKSPRYHQGTYSGVMERKNPSCLFAERDNGFLNPLFSDDSGDIGPELPAMDLNLSINTTEPHEFDQGAAPCLPGIMSPMDSQGHTGPRFGQK